MLRRIIAITTTFVAVAGFALNAEAAPFNAARRQEFKGHSDALIQVRGGRGGGGGFRAGGFGGGRGFAWRVRPARTRPRALPSPSGIVRIARAVAPPGAGLTGHGGHWKKKKIILIGGGYDAGPDCSYLWNRWQATGSIIGRPSTTSASASEPATSKSRQSPIRVSGQGFGASGPINFPANSAIAGEAATPSCATSCRPSRP
ncbi:MAG: hypothetical protein R3E48_23130 [Burkholderiaceae bacterium]